MNVNLNIKYKNIFFTDGNIESIFHLRIYNCHIIITIKLSKNFIDQSSFDQTTHSTKGAEQHYANFFPE